MRKVGCGRAGLLAAAAMGALLLTAPAAMAQEVQRQEYNLEAQDLDSALRTVSRQSGQEIVYPTEAVAGKRAPKIHGSFTAEEAVRALLAGSDLVADFREDSILIRGRSSASGEVADRSTTTTDIVVTGSRIRGAKSPSPIILLTQTDIRNSGQSNLDEVMRSIPQNFSGGQNPGVGVGVPERNGSNIGSGSAINLRGLGQDATLTLLNGHRLAYNSAFQGVDISAIPLAAVDRIEIVADGASALYGSDAVAGVANVILKRDYDGFAAIARFGASTDGGNEQQQYTILGGQKWEGGGFLATYDFAKTTAALARSRDYTRSLWGDTTILPPITQHNALLSAHQDVSSSLSITIDGLYNHRETASNVPFTNTGDYTVLGSLGSSKTTSFAVAPTVRFKPSNDWEFALTGLYAEDNTDYGSNTYQNGAVVSVVSGTYYNTTKSLELAAEGRLFTLPGGDARLAAGGGYRVNHYIAFRAKRPRQVDETQDASYAFAEINMPLIGEDQGVPAVSRFILSLAGRYENYPGIASVVTPKVGLIYSPIKGISLKGTWGRSFKAPQFYQRFAVQNTYIYNTSAVGGTGYPANATVLYRTGGNPNLGPERASTWTATISVEPAIVPGASFDISYFDVSYRNRVVAPFPSSGSALSNPAFASLVNLAPTAAQIANVYASADQIFNSTGRAYNPASVVAIIDAVNTNASSQKIRGVDLAGRYRFQISPTASISLLANGTYIESEQQLSAGQPVLQLAGAIFNPPHFRARGGAVFDGSDFVFSSYLNYTGGVIDNRYPSRPRVSSMTTLDLAARVTIAGKAEGPNLELDLAVQNLFNAKPGLIAKPYDYATPYDSTNYSAVGRFVSFSLSARF